MTEIVVHSVFFPPVLFCSKVPAFLNVVDIAGLVKGAHAGQGLGNAFLSHISACDGIFHMTRESGLGLAQRHRFDLKMGEGTLFLYHAFK